MVIEQGDSLEIDRSTSQLRLEGPAGSSAAPERSLAISDARSSLDVDALTRIIRSRFDHGLLKLQNLASQWRINGSLDNLGSLVRSRPHADEVAVPLLDLLYITGKYPKSSAILGLGDSQQTMMHDFLDPNTPHLLITGGQDAGKTTMLRTIAVSLAINNRQSDLQLAAICPRTNNAARDGMQHAAWFPLNFLPHMLCDVAESVPDVTRLLTFLDREARHREQHGFKRPTIVLLIDDVETVRSLCGRESAESLQRLAQRGEDAGIHLVVSTRAMEFGQMSTQFLANFRIRLAGWNPLKVDALVPESDTLIVNSELLGKGDFLLHSGQSRPLRLQGALIDDYDLQFKLAEICRPRAILLAKPFSKRVQLKNPVQSTPIKREQTSIEEFISFPG